MTSIGVIVLVNVIVSFCLLLMYLLVRYYIFSTILNLSFILRFFVVFFIPMVLLIANFSLFKVVEEEKVKWIFIVIAIYFLILILKYVFNTVRVNFLHSVFESEIERSVKNQLVENKIDLSKSNINIIVRPRNNKIYCKIVVRLNIDGISDNLIKKLNLGIKSKIKEINNNFIIDIFIFCDK